MASEKEHRLSLLNDICLKMNSLQKSQANLLNQLDHIVSEVNEVKMWCKEQPIRREGMLFGGYWDSKNKFES